MFENEFRSQNSGGGAVGSTPIWRVTAIQNANRFTSQLLSTLVNSSRIQSTLRPPPGGFFQVAMVAVCEDRESIQRQSKVFGK